MLSWTPAHPLLTPHISLSRPHRDAIEIQALAGKTKVAARDKKGVNCSAEKAKEDGATTKAIPLGKTLDPCSSSSFSPPPPTAAAAVAAANPLPEVAPSLRSLLERNRPRPPPDTHSQLELAVARFEALAPRLPPPPPLSMLCPGVYKRGGGGRSGGSEGRSSQPRQQQPRSSGGGSGGGGGGFGASVSDAGCGAPLEPWSHRAAPCAEGGGGAAASAPVTRSWRCSTRPRCSYQETPPERIAAPRLALEVVLAANPERAAAETLPTATPPTQPQRQLHPCLVPPPPPAPPSYELLVAPARGAEDCVSFCGGVGPVLCALGLRGLVLLAEERKSAAAAAGAETEGETTTAAAAPAPPAPSLSLRLPLACYERVEARLLAARVARAPALPAAGRVPAGVLAALRGGGGAPPAAGGPGRLGARAPAASASAGGGPFESERPSIARVPEVPEEEVAARFARIPLALAASLLPFQREGVAFALRAGGRALNCDEMGVGKTVQALAAVAAYREEWPALVVCPASLRLAWAEEAERWLGGVLRPSRVAVVDGAASALAPGDEPDLAITSFEMLARRSCASCTRDSARAAAELGARKSDGGGRNGGGSNNSNNSTVNINNSTNSSTLTINRTTNGSSPFAPCPGRAGGCMAGRGWRVLVVDESHVLRTGLRAPDARATEAAAAAASRARRAVFLTGTPSLSKPYDLWRQVDALAPGLLPRTRDAFAARYCGRRLLPLFGFSSGSGGGGACVPPSFSAPPFTSSFVASPSAPMRVDVSGLTHGRELAAVLRRSVMVRRLKSDVCGQLPPKRRQVVLLPRPRPGDWKKLARAAAERGGGGGGGGGGAAVGGAAARKRKGGAGGQQQQRAPPLSLAELAAAREKKQSQKSKKARRGGGDGDDCEEEEEEEEPAFAFFGDDDDGEREDFVDLDDDGENNDDDDPSRSFQRPDPRSDAHRTALAKLPAVIEWLSTVFGCGGAGSSSAAASNLASAAASSQATPPPSSPTLATATPATRQQEQPPKTIIFAHHHDVMDALASALASFGIRHVRIDGSVDGADRRAAVEAFRSGARGVRAALLSVTAAGTGLDFASASSVVFAELPDEPALVRQAEDRAHRRGRGEGEEGGGANGGKGGGMPLNVYFLIAKGTSDERRWRALDAGLQRVAEALADEGKGGGGKGSGRRGRERPSQVSQTPLEGGRGRRRRRFGSSSGGGSGGDARGLAVDRIREVHSQAVTHAAAAAEAAAAAASLLAAARATPDTLAAGGSTPASPRSRSAPAAAPSPSPRLLPQLPTPESAANADPLASPASSLGGSVVSEVATPAAEPAAAATPRTVSPAAAENEERDGRQPLAAAASPSPFSSPFPPFPRLAWFELSPHTGRLHLHGSPDGSAPLGLSVPLEAVAVASSGSGSGSIPARESRSGRGLEDGAVAVLSAALVAPGGPCFPATGRPLPSPETLCCWARDASELAGELSELRGVLRARFAAGGRLLRPPLTMATAAAGGEGGGGGAGETTTAAPGGTDDAENDGSGRGTARHDAPRAPLPEVLELLEQKRRRLRGAVGDGGGDGDDAPRLPARPSRARSPPRYSVLEVPVAVPAGGPLRAYAQAFDARGRRLCLACGAPTPCQLRAAAPLLAGRALLFCGGRCDAAHAARTSASGARAALFRAERGVCCACGLDCHSLVRDLRAVGRGDGGGGGAETRRAAPSLRRRRLALILARAPSFRGARAAAAAARLASSAVEGHAWQADHVVAVHRGGGSCGVGNLRTLCVPCHAGVTAVQASERARRRRRERREQGGRGELRGGGGAEEDGREEGGDEDGEDGDNGGFLLNGPPAGLQRALLLHARMEQESTGPRFIDDDDDEEEDVEEEEDEESGGGGGGGSGQGRPLPAAARRALAAALLMPPPPPRRPPTAASAAPARAPASRPLAELAARAGGGSRQRPQPQPQQQRSK